MKTSRIFGLSILLLVIMLNPWWWIILQRDLWVGLLVFVLSFIVFQYFFQNKSSGIFFILSVLTGILILISLSQALDESIVRTSALEIQQYNKRHEYYASSLGKIYTNRFSLAYFKEYNFPLLKLQRNFFANLDPNLYFFASHPRERLGIEEFGKYLSIFLPFFLWGFLFCLYKPLPKILIYLVVISLISSTISPSYNLGPILFFPIFNFLITVGLILGLRTIKR